jgi:NTP pyrophosphatase (non-canonical NTP hydrolase)
MLDNGILGLAGEVGELVDLYKKVKHHGHILDHDKVLSELGDIRYYLELVTHKLGFTMSEVETSNTNKLRVRYPEGFSSERSVHRET